MLFRKTISSVECDKVVFEPLLANDIDILSANGKCNSSSRLPQYLHKAIFDGAKQVAIFNFILDNNLLPNIFY